MDEERRKQLHELEQKLGLSFINKELNPFSSSKSPFFMYRLYGLGASPNSYFFLICSNSRFLCLPLIIIRFP
jgi:hypothetical protein